MMAIALAAFSFGTRLVAMVGPIEENTPVSQAGDESVRGSTIRRRLIRWSAVSGFGSFRKIQGWTFDICLGRKDRERGC